MNTQTFTYPRNFLLATTVIILMLSTGSCVEKRMFSSSSVVPAATGSIKIKRDKNQNYNIEIEIVDLASADMLQPPRETYVVWMDSEENTTRNIGQLKSSTSVFSKRLKASMETVSTTRPRRIFITAENDANARNPNSEVVLTTGFLENLN